MPMDAATMPPTKHQLLAAVLLVYDPVLFSPRFGVDLNLLFAHLVLILLKVTCRLTASLMGRDPLRRYNYHFRSRVALPSRRLLCLSGAPLLLSNELTVTNNLCNKRAGCATVRINREGTGGSPIITNSIQPSLGAFAVHIAFG